MMKQHDYKIHIGFKAVILLVLVATLFRFINPFVPALSNFTPVGALALFSGAYFTQKRWAFAIPLLTMWLSDLALNNIIYAKIYPDYYTKFVWVGDFWVYLPFILTVLMGLVLLGQPQQNKSRLFVASLSSSILFFLISNFGVWLQSGMYARTWQGFIECYTLAIPFFRNTVLGDLFYVALLFGAAEYLKFRKLQSLKI